VRSSNVEPPRAGKRPPSTISGSASAKALLTSPAVTQAGSPLRFALVAVIGWRNRFSNSIAKDASGNRIPTVPVPAVTVAGKREPARTITVSGPGQNCAATRSSNASRSATLSAIVNESTSSRIGLLSGLPLRRKISAIAASLNGSAPSPYAVSVGKAITPPERKSDRIRSKSRAQSDSVRTISIGAEIIVGHLPLGKHNARLAALRKAVQQGELTPEGLLPIEGPKLLEEAMRSGIEVIDVFLRRGVGVAQLPADAAVYEVDSRTFKTLQTTETSQGIIAVVRPPAHSLDRIVGNANPLIVVLGRLQDPGNVGTILRIAESFSATGCIAIGGTADVHNPKVVRASAGSVFRLPYVWNVHLDDLREGLESAGIPLVGTSASAPATIEEFDWTRPAALWIGNEGGGMAAEEIGACNAMLRIRHNPAVESLNSAIAAAIILYEASGKRLASERGI
jgi:RNA methyltransferase, TrmH family